jgi:tetratricopeptide (TPR) repeat protein
MAKKITRKQLLKEPDEFMTFSGRLMDFMAQNKTSLIIALCSVFAAIMIVTGIRYASNQSENEAFVLLQENMGKYDTLMKDNDPKKAYQGVKDDFEKFFQQYSGKTAAKLARVAFANICYDAGESAKAIELYQSAMADFGNELSLKASISNGLAYAYEANKDDANALKYFEIASESESPVKGEALFNMARLYAKKGDTAKSTEAYKKIVSEHSDSVYVQVAKERIAG